MIPSNADANADTVGEHERRGPAGSFEQFSPSIAAAWRDSRMASFPPHVTEALLEDAREVTFKRGEVFYRGPSTARL